MIFTHSYFIIHNKYGGGSSNYGRFNCSLILIREFQAWLGIINRYVHGWEGGKRICVLELEVSVMWGSIIFCNSSRKDRIFPYYICQPWLRRVVDERGSDSVGLSPGRRSPYKTKEEENKRSCSWRI
jgi:hypothetical protein